MPFKNEVNNSDNGNVRLTKRNTFYNMDYFWNNVAQSLRSQNISFEVYLPLQNKSGRPKGIKINKYRIKPMNSVKETVKKFSTEKVKNIVPLLNIAKRHHGFNLSRPYGFNGAVRFITNSLTKN